MWQGRHHSAQKSTMTGCDLLAVSTSVSKFPSFTTRMFSAIFVFVPLRLHKAGASFYGLDVVTGIRFRAALAASYSFAYSAADMFHEKSLAIPFSCIRFQMPSFE